VATRDHRAGPEPTGTERRARHRSGHTRGAWAGGGAGGRPGGGSGVGVIGGAGPAGPLPPGLQRSVVVGSRGDRWEREADTAADRLLDGRPAGALTPATPAAVQAAAVVELEESAEDDLLQPASSTAAPVPAPRTEEGEDDDSALPAPPSGPGTPLPAATRAAVEAGFGEGFDDVRVHADAPARATADALGARAYTHGRDIYLGTGSSPDDLWLMAHEGAHVIQQAGRAGLAQRAAGGASSSTTGGAAGGGAVAAAGQGGGAPAAPLLQHRSGNDLYDATDPNVIRVHLGTLEVAPIKAGEPVPSKPFEAGRARTNRHRDEWKTAAAKAVTAEDVEDKLKTPHFASDPELSAFAEVHYLKTPRGVLVTGDTKALVEAVRYPYWTRSGEHTQFDVDHRLEYQLGGEDVAANLWLLEASANRSAGSTIATNLRERVDRLLTAASTAGVAGVPPSFNNLKARNRRNSQRKWMLSIGSFSGGATGPEPLSWTIADLEKVEPLTKLRPLSAAEAAQQGAPPGAARVFFAATGGRSSVISDVTQGPDGWWFSDGTSDLESRRNIHITGWTFTPGSGGQLRGTRFQRNKRIGLQSSAVEIPLASWGALTNAYFMQGRSLTDQFSKDLHFIELSLIELDVAEPDFDKGVVARGRLLPSIPLIAGAEIDVVIDGNDIYLSKVFTAGDFDFPGPIDVGECSLELRLGTQGFAILGEANFAVPNIGTGQITAEATANTQEVGFALAGRFDFLSDLFDPARIEVWYREGAFGGRGELGIPAGRIAGLRSASVVALWQDETLTADGRFETDLPGVESGTLGFIYRPDGSFELGGTLELGGDVPGISSGRVEASVSRDDEGQWHVRGVITAVPAIPGVSTRLTGVYEDGVVTLSAEARYERGMAAGSLAVGVTNQALDAAGRPTGEATAELRAFGGGAVTLALAPWLQATAGVRILSEGGIEVAGEIGLPAALEIFPERAWERELFSVNLDIPIVGLAVAGQRIGIFATIGGGASLRAFIGPAQLRELRVGVIWNPDLPEATTVSGDARLHLPAGAALRLHVNAGLGVGIPLVSATLGLEIGGALGVQATIGADFRLDWTPAAGLALEAVAEASAAPTFRFDVSGFAKVELDLLLRTLTLYEERWELAAIEYGSGLQLGLRVPVRYAEGEPFEPSLDDVELLVPDIDPAALLSGLVGRIV
jgi:hypothetical protein